MQVAFAISIRRSKITITITDDGSPDVAREGRDRQS
jgi:hypothetical protein